MNPRLPRLQPFPFERLRQWFADVTPNPALAPISLSIGEPRHPTPPLVLDALLAGARGLANYPMPGAACRHGQRPVAQVIRRAAGH